MVCVDGRSRNHESNDHITVCELHREVDDMYEHFEFAVSKHERNNITVLRYIERWIKWARVEFTGKLSWTKINQKPK
jgi:hypothetical protein